jgi:Ca-activated chloride channel family protein
MRADVQLSTKFLTTQNAHQVGLLVTIGADAPVNRSPINVALVLDRSGSMAGEPLAAAKDAALRFARFLGPADRLSVVAFDDQVLTVYGPRAGGDPAVEAAIRPIGPGGSTNLSGGWLKGRSLVESGLVTGTNRVVLLTDGMANNGITDPQELAALAGGAQAQGVSTTTIGFGPHFNEDLLKAMSAAGRGNAWYVERTDQMTGIFDEEIEGLVTLAGQNVEVEIRLSHPQVQGVTLLQEYPVRRDPDGTWHVTLGDCLATSPLALGLVFHVEEVRSLGEARLGDVTVRGDFLVAGGIEHRSTRLAVMANLDGVDHLQPEVERTLVRFQVAQARDQAVRAADRGQLEEAATLMHRAASTLASACPEAGEEIADLTAQAEQLRERRYTSEDRKYNMAMKEAMFLSKMSYAERIRRR